MAIRTVLSASSGAADGVLAPIHDASAYFDYWYALFPRPSLIARISDFQVLWRNASADALFEGPDFNIVGGALTITDRAQAAEFRAALASLGKEPKACCHRRRDGDDHHVILLQLLEPAGKLPAVAMTFHCSTSPTRYVWADIAPIFGLTPAEASIVKQLIAGARADVIANDLGISLDTVRTHIRRIYAKMNVQSREQLFSAVSPFRVG